MGCFQRTFARSCLASFPPRFLARFAVILDVGLRFFGSAAGQGEEDVLERRTAKSDVVDRDSGIVQIAKHSDQELCPTDGRDGDAAGMTVDSAVAITAAREQLGR